MPRQHIKKHVFAYLFHQTEAALQVKLGERVANVAQCTICLKNLPEAPAPPIFAKFGVFIACFGFRLSYHLPLCVPHSAIPFACRVMSPTHFRCLITSHQRRHRYSLGQLQLQSLHPTSLGPQGSHDKVRHTVSGCNALSRSISMKE